MQSFEQPVELESPHEFLLGVLHSLPCEPATSLPSEWAENNRYLTEASTPHPGKFSWRRSPYWREPLDHLSPHSTTQKVAIMKPTQIGFTCAVLENAIGFTIACQPAPIIYVSGDENAITTTKKTRIEPMLDNSGLRDKIRPDATKKGKRRTGDSGNLTEFPGGFMRLCGPNTEANFQSISFKTLLLDEVDLYPHKLGNSGETVKVIEGRADAFGPKKKILYGSRPTVSFGVSDTEDEDGESPKSPDEVGSRILELYNIGDKRKYFVPCPHCGEKQELSFFKQKSHDGIEYGLNFDSAACREGDFSSVEYICRGCGKGIQEYHKSEIVQPEAGAEWVATAKAKEPHFVSYQISSLYSLTVTWVEMVVEFLGAKGDPKKLQTFYNRFLGQPFEDRTGGVEVAKLADKKGGYPSNTLPKGVLFLTAACDVQRGKKGRLEVEIRGWGRDHRSWGIDYRIIKGNPEDKNDECWDRLSDILDESWGPEGKLIERMFIDSGDGVMTSIVYETCKKHGRGDQVLMIPVKGLTMTARTRDYQKSVELADKRFPLVEIYVDLYKNRWANWLKQDWRPGESAPTGWAMFPDGYTREYFRQLGNEERVRVGKGAHTIVKWVSKGKHEAWDVLVYGSACADFVIDDYSRVVLHLEKYNAEAVWDYFDGGKGLSPPE